MMDSATLLKIAGAVLAFALGIWIGLGTPGIRQRARPRAWRASDRLRATWINRVFFKMERPPRRFGGNLVAPRQPGPAAEEVEVEEGGSDELPSPIRLRRSGER